MLVPDHKVRRDSVKRLHNHTGVLAMIGMLSALMLGAVVAVPDLWPAAGGGIAALVVMLAAIARPRRALIGLVAFPPGLLALIAGRIGLSNPLMYAVIGASFIAFWLGPRRVGHPGLVVGYIGILGLMSLSMLRNQVPDAFGAAGALTTFFFYGALYSLVLNIAPADASGRRHFADALHIAVLVSVLGSGLIALAQLGPSVFTAFNVKLFPEDTGLLYSRTHFGYFVALGFAAAFPRWLLARERRLAWAGLTALTMALVVVSLTRGAWLGSLVLAVALMLLTRRWLLLGTVPLTALFALIPGVRSRLTSDLAGGALLAIQSGAAGSHRVLLWAVLFGVALRAPWLGHGFGYVSSLYPSIFFGDDQFVTQANALVYAHNDLLYLLLELGIIGVAMYVAAAANWWASLLRSVRWAQKHVDSAQAPLVLTCLGAGIIVLIAQSVDNGFFIRAVFERFAVIAATLWLVQTAVRHDETDFGGAES